MTRPMIAFAALIAVVMSHTAYGAMVLCNTLGSQAEFEQSVVGPIRRSFQRPTVF
jgi:hypothetical protein